MLKDYENFINENRKLSKVYTDSNGYRIYDGNFYNGKFSVINGKLKIQKNQVIRGDFSCNGILLTTLEGCPDTVLGDFNCGYNKLKSLKGGPSNVFGKYSCYDNKLMSLEGYPKEFKGEFFIQHSLTIKLKIEMSYVKSSFHNYDNYYTGLLEYMITTNININDIKTWPEGFLDSNLGKSAKSIGKFNL